jgi:hypothetical protein
MIERDPASARRVDWAMRALPVPRPALRLHCAADRDPASVTVGDGCLASGCLENWTRDGLAQGKASRYRDFDVPVFPGDAREACKSASIERSDGYRRRAHKPG